MPTKPYRRPTEEQIRRYYSLQREALRLNPIAVAVNIAVREMVAEAAKPKRTNFYATSK